MNRTILHNDHKRHEIEGSQRYTFFMRVVGSENPTITEGDIQRALLNLETQTSIQEIVIAQILKDRQAKTGPI